MISFLARCRAALRARPRPPRRLTREGARLAAQALGATVLEVSQRHNLARRWGRWRARRYLVRCFATFDTWAPPDDVVEFWELRRAAVAEAVRALDATCANTWEERRRWIEAKKLLQLSADLEARLGAEAGVR